MAARRTRKRKPEPASAGLTPGEVAEIGSPPELEPLEAGIRQAGGHPVARYRDPWGGRCLVLAALPLTAVEPTPFQRDLSATHAKRLAERIGAVGTFLDPIVAVAAPDGATAAFWTPNGRHRLDALSKLGARSVMALVSPDPSLAYRILALNTEKAHNVRERALEAVRMERSLAELDPARPESDYALELEEGALVTLGLAYESRSRFAGGAWSAVLRPSDPLLDLPIRETLAKRSRNAERLLALDDRVSGIVERLRERGLESPYLRNFVVARIRPFRRRGQEAPALEALFDHMERAAGNFDPARIRESQIAKTGGLSDD